MTKNDPLEKTEHPDSAAAAPLATRYVPGKGLVEVTPPNPMLKDRRHNKAVAKRRKAKQFAKAQQRRNRK